jgi:hypothetical protein
MWGAAVGADDTDAQLVSIIRQGVAAGRSNAEIEREVRAYADSVAPGAGERLQHVAANISHYRTQRGEPRSMVGQSLAVDRGVEYDPSIWDDEGNYVGPREGGPTQGEVFAAQRALGVDQGSLSADRNIYLYNALTDRLPGLSQYERNAIADRARGGPLEMILGPEEITNIVTRIGRGDASGLDYLIAGVMALPVGRLGRAAARSPVGQAASRGWERAKGFGDRVYDTASDAAEGVAQRVGELAARGFDPEQIRRMAARSRSSYLDDDLAARAARNVTPSTASRPALSSPAPALPAPSAQRPSYTAAEQAGALAVARQGLQPEVNPDLASGSIADLRARMADPAQNPALRLADEESMAVRGVPFSTESMPQTSLARQGGIARMFEAATEGSPEYKHALFERYGETMPQVVEQAGAQNYDQLTEAAYRQLGQDVQQQFDRLPVGMQYHYGDLEYPTPSAMFRDALGRGNLNVFRGGDRHPFLSDVDPQTGLTQNEMFRAVHDYLGHASTGATFRPGGEEVAYAAHAQTLSPLAQMALLSETRGQNSWVNYGTANADLVGDMERLRRNLREHELLDAFGQPKRNVMGNMTDFDVQRAAELRRDAPPAEDIRRQLRDLGQQFQYAAQEPVLLPPEYLPIDSAGGVPEWARGLIVPRSPVDTPAQHYSRVPDLQQTDPRFYGTGHQGDDYALYRRGLTDKRTMFYVPDDPASVATPEPSVAARAPYRYTADLEGLYDLEADPERLVALARAYAGRDTKTGEPYQRILPWWLDPDFALDSPSAIPDLERLVREYGYRGYIAPHGSARSAAVFGPTSVRRAP